MKRVFDFHSHILPEIDDGSRSMEESLAMLRMEVAQGIHHVVATPHFYPRHHDLKRFLHERKEAEEKLRQRLACENDFLKISVGAEVYFFKGISESDLLNQLTISEKQYILIEMPESPWNESMYRELERIYINQNLTPIIAHIDRYISPFRNHDLPERLLDLPVLVQANASFFLKRMTAGMALRLLKRGQIHLLGSDCHNLQNRPPRLGEAIEVIRNRLGEQVLNQMDVIGNQILNDN